MLMTSAILGILAINGLVQPTLGAISVRQNSSSSTSSSTNSNNPAAAVNEQVAFLQTLQAAQVSSMSCLITLVNMTVNPIGSCLGLTTLSELVVRPPDNGSFADQLGGYLTTTCGGAQCTDEDIAETKALMRQTCDPSKDTQLVRVISAILDNYTNSYRTLACSVFFNGTGEGCLAATMNTSQAANNNDFFNNLVTGNDMQQYQASVFEQAKCTGCMYELYKAAVYMIPNIRGKSVTQAFGNHLQSCGNEAGQDWSNVQDQQIPSALQVRQSTGRPVGAAYRQFEGSGGLGGALVGLAAGVGMIVVSRRM